MKIKVQTNQVQTNQVQTNQVQTNQVQTNQHSIITKLLSLASPTAALN